MSTTDLRVSLLARIAETEANPDVSSGAAIAEQHGYLSALRDVLGDVDELLTGLRAGSVDPRLLRWCVWPGCFDSFDATSGPADEGWWRRGLTVLCPPHSASGHRPGYAIALTDLSALPATCSCGAGERVSPSNWESVVAWWTTHVQAVTA